MRRALSAARHAVWDPVRGYRTLDALGALSLFALCIAIHGGAIVALHVARPAHLVDPITQHLRDEGVVDAEIASAVDRLLTARAAARVVAHSLVTVHAAALLIIFYFGIGLVLTPLRG